jgi:death-on-curing protein
VTDYLSLEDLLTLVDDLGVGPVRDVGLLESAAHRPTAALWGREVYATLDEKAAALLESFAGSHALADGNTRLGWLGVVVFYGLNGIDLDAPDDDAYDLVVGVASGSIERTEAATTLAHWH